MPEKRISIKVSGVEGKSEGRVLFSDLLVELEKVRAAMREAERVCKGTLEVDYRVVGLAMNSPSPRVDLMPTVNRERVSASYLDDVTTALASSLAAVVGSSLRPSSENMALLEAFEAMVPSDRRQISKVEITVGEDSFAVDEAFKKSLKSIMGQDEIYHGSIRGALEVLNLHNENNTFTLFPIIGPEKIRGRFKKDLREKVKLAMDQFVTVYGKLKCKSWLEHPYEIVADDIQIHPPEEELPTLLDLKGVAPQATGDLSSSEFLEQLRNEWQS